MKHIFGPGLCKYFSIASSMIIRTLPDNLKRAPQRCERCAYPLRAPCVCVILSAIVILSVLTGMWNFLYPFESFFLKALKPYLLCYFQSISLYFPSSTKSPDFLVIIAVISAPSDRYCRVGPDAAVWIFSIHEVLMRGSKSFFAILSENACSTLQIMISIAVF